MVYFAILIFTLLLSHIARAMHACGDAASPQDVYNAYDDEEIFATFSVSKDIIYDNPDGNTPGVVCSDLAKTFPLFPKFPAFPYLGGAFDIKYGSAKNPTCGQCWKLTNKKTSRSIYLTAIDAVTNSAFNIGSVAYNDLDGGSGSTTPMEVEAARVSNTPCVARS